MPTTYQIVEFGFVDDSVVYAIRFKSGFFSWEFVRNPRTGEIMYFYSMEEAEREAEQILG